MPSFPRSFPRRGEIYLVAFNPARGSEQAGTRPAVIVSNEVNNQHSPVVVVAAMTRTIYPKQYPQNVQLPAGRPLNDAGTILGGQLYTIDQQRLIRHRGELDPSQLQALNNALRKSLQL